MEKRKRQENTGYKTALKYLTFSIFMQLVSLRKYRNTVTCAAEHPRKYLLRLRYTRAHTHTLFEHDQPLETFTAAFLTAEMQTRWLHLQAPALHRHEALQLDGGEMGPCVGQGEGSVRAGNIQISRAR